MDRDLYESFAADEKKGMVSIRCRDAAAAKMVSRAAVEAATHHPKPIWSVFMNGSDVVLAPCYAGFAALVIAGLGLEPGAAAKSE